MTMARTIKLYKLPDATATPGIRSLEARDVPAATRLLVRYLQRFRVAPVFSEEEVAHWWVGGRPGGTVLRFEAVLAR